MGSESDTFDQEGEFNIPELQSDLRQKYRNVGEKVQEIWRGFTPKQRERAMREAVGDGRVLKDSRDPGLSGLRHILPDWNLKDITSAPDFFLDRLHHRVDSNLHDQILKGVNEIAGDRETVRAGAQLMKSPRPGQYALFIDLGKDYGMWVKPTGAPGRHRLEHMDEISGLSVPSKEANLIIERQKLTYIFYNQLIEEILDMGSESRAKKQQTSKRTTNEQFNAMARLTIIPKPLKASIADVITQAAEQKATSEDYLALLRSEPVVLNHAVNATNWSRPEFIRDDCGRILPMIADKYISFAFFEVVCNAVKGIITWEYILQLLRMFEGNGIDDRIKRPLVIQELSNVCHLEYRRAQSTFGRQMSQCSLGVAGKSFRRITTNGASRIVIKGQPSDHTVSNPQLHYILRLCHANTRHTDAAQWLQKLAEHNTRHPDDLERLDEEQVRALGDLAIIVSFMHVLSTSLAMVSGSKKLGIFFTGRMTELDAQLATHKTHADFGDHLVPADNLLEPDTARNALQALDKFMRERAGSSLGSLYEDVLHGSLENVEKRYFDTKTIVEKAEAQQQRKHSYVPLSSESEPFSSMFRAEQRREKAKTRPTDAATAYDIIAIDAPELDTVATCAPRYKVKASTASVFSTMFAKTTARGSVSWVEFTGAMADLEFSVMPRGGSVFTFHPSESIDGKRSITLHRPHASEIEGYKLLIFSKRLHKTYGWTAETFEVV